MYIIFSGNKRNEEFFDIHEKEGTDVCKIKLI
jgi:hypothetical protein